MSRRAIWLAITLLGLILASAVTSAPVAAGAVNASINAVSVTPERPVPGESVTVSATIRNLPSSTSDLTVNNIVLRSVAASPTRYDRVGDLGSLSPGTSLDVPLSASFDDAGSWTLRVLVNGTTEAGHHVNLTYPVSVTVRDRHPGLTIDVDDAVTGVETTALVTVGNGFDRDLRDLAVSFDGFDGVQRRVSSRLGGGQTSQFTFPVTPGSTGVVPVTARVDYTLAGGPERTTSTESTIVVRDPGRPRLTVDVTDPIAGVETTATVAVSNGLDRPIEDLELRLRGLPSAQPRRVLPTLPAGESTTFTYRVTPEVAGATPVQTALEYTIGTGGRRMANATSTVAVDPHRDRVTLAAAAKSGSIDVSISNLGNAPVTGLIVNGTAATATIGKVTVAELAPSASTTVSLPVSGLSTTESARVTVAAQYALRGDPAYDGRSASDTVSYEATPGADIALTGISVEAVGGERVRITGSASNVGLIEANSVIVGVLSAADVEPAEPNREYFVGTVPGSDFVSFDVYARLDGDASTVPLEVRYLADGSTKTRAVSVELPSIESTESAERGGGIPIAIVAGAAVILVVLATPAVAWRVRRVDP